DEVLLRRMHAAGPHRRRLRPRGHPRPTNSPREHRPPPAAAARLPPAKPNIPPTPEDTCRAIEQDAAENELPVEFFARVIWQESRFNAHAVSPKGALGNAQFIPQTANFRGPQNFPPALHLQSQ